MHERPPDAHDDTDEEREDVGLYAPAERYSRDLDRTADAPEPPDAGGQRREREPPSGADTSDPDPND